MSKKKQTFQDRAQQALLEYTFLRWESATLVSLTFLLTVLSFYFKDTDIVPTWAWIVFLLFGVIGEAFLVYTSLTDPETSQQVIIHLLYDKFHPERLHSNDLQKKMDKAFDYRSRIETAISRDRVLKKHLNEMVEQVSEWLKNIYVLVQRLDRYQGEKELFEADKVQVNQRINELQRQIATETDVKIKQQLQVFMEGMRHQHQTIAQLESTMAMAELQLEHTLSTLGTIYSQTLLIEAKDIGSHHENGLRQEITKEMNKLTDILAAMEAVYSTEQFSRLG